MYIGGVLSGQVIGSHLQEKEEVDDNTRREFICDNVILLSSAQSDALLDRFSM